MPKIRTIKPDLYRHLTLFEAEQACGLPLRLAFTGLLTCADREGRFRWQPRVLKLDVLPFDEVDFGSVLEELAKAGFILKYSVDEQFYGLIPSWHKHQRINPHEPSSQLPEPVQCATTIFNTTAPCSPSPTGLTLSTQEQFTSHSIATASTPAISETQKGGKSHRSVLTVSQTSTSSVQTVFEHWKTTFQHPKALLDDKRQQLIQKALQQGYTVSNLCDAITGCAQTPYNCGDNQQGERYDGLHVILRDADQIERFIRHCYNPPQPLHPQNKRVKASAIAAQRWLQQVPQEVS